MKMAVVYNRESTNVINLFGVPNRERVGRRQIERMVDALREGGHEVRAIEGDKDLIDNLEGFMPRVLKRERPGIVFNVSYGIQGRSRYSHVPSMMEMLGIPYVGSGPLAHSLALDKVVTKVMLRQRGVPTPDFVVVPPGRSPRTDLGMPLVVKPQHEAGSLGVRIVEDGEGLRAAVRAVHEDFAQNALVESYIEGREFYTGILGNDDPDVFPPIELVFDAGLRVSTYEDKQGTSGRQNKVVPAEVDAGTEAEAGRLALAAYQALLCNDFARVDFRMQEDGRLFVLEVNTLPGLDEASPYPAGAAAAGIPFGALVNRLVETACRRYFGGRFPLVEAGRQETPAERALAVLAGRQSRIEDRLRRWTEVESRTDDSLAVQEVAHALGRDLGSVGLSPVADLTDGHHAWTWSTTAGLAGGVLLALPLDVPVDAAAPPPRFRQHREWLQGEGIASSRGPLVMLLEALEALDREGLLAEAPVGVFAYGDDGVDGQFSQSAFRQAASRASAVLVLDPVGLGEGVTVQAPGRVVYQLVLERRAGQGAREVIQQGLPLLAGLLDLDADAPGAEVDLRHIRTDQSARRSPHRLQAGMVVRFHHGGTDQGIVAAARERLAGTGLIGRLEEQGRHPPLEASSASRRLVRRLRRLANAWDLSLPETNAARPTFAGAAPPGVAALGGKGPPCRGLHGPPEAIHRPAFLERTILLTQLLLEEGRRRGGAEGRKASSPRMVKEILRGAP